MKASNCIRATAVALMLAVSVATVPGTIVHAEPNNEGIEMDCPLSGNWVANGGYVITKDAQGNYHRVYCIDGEWVDGGVITSFRAVQTAPTRTTVGSAALP